MPIALIANTMKTGNTTSSAIDTTGANFLVVSIGSGAAATLTDSKGNAWTSLTTYGTSFAAIRILYCASPTVGSGHTFTLAGGSLARFCIAAFSGAKASLPFDQQSGATAGSGVTIQTGSVTPSEDNELLITAGSQYVQAAPTINSGFVFSNKDAYGTDSGITGGMAYKIQTTAGAENPTWSWGGSYAIGVAIATFKAEPVAASSLPRRSKVISQALNFSTNW